MEEKKKILIVEDEAAIAELEKDYLELSGFQVETEGDGEKGLKKALEGNYDLLILDLMLPGRDGFSITQEVRSKKDIPILLVSARRDDIDKIRGLGLGADDYMTKPFVPEELLARVRALSRRQGEVLLDELRFGDLCLSLATNELITPGQSVRLAFKEAELLKLLIANKGVILSKETILRKLWGDESDAVENNVEAYVSFLRKKLSFLRSSVKIQAIRRQGYLLLEEETR